MTGADTAAPTAGHTLRVTIGATTTRTGGTQLAVVLGVECHEPGEESCRTGGGGCLVAEQADGGRWLEDYDGSPGVPVSDGMPIDVRWDPVEESYRWDVAASEAPALAAAAVEAFRGALAQHTRDGEHRMVRLAAAQQTTGQDIHPDRAPAVCTLPPHAADVMTLYGFPFGADALDGLWWRTGDDGAITLFACCSDVFDWGTADLEEIGVDDVSLLRACLEDLRPTGDEDHIGVLFAARKRGRRPMRQWLATIETRAGALFEAAADGAP